MTSNKFTPEQLDRYLQIAAFVDDKLPNPIPKNTPAMYKILQILPDKNTYKDSDTSTAKPKIIPTSRQIGIYDFILLLMLHTKPQTRELVYLKNFPHTKSYRSLKRLYLDCSHEKLRYMYKKALLEACKIANIHFKKFINL